MKATFRAAEVVLVVVGLFVVWHAASVVTGLPRFVFPAPLDVLGYLVEEHETILENTVTTFQEVVIGFVIALAIAIPTTVALTSSRLIEKTVFPLLIVIRTTPTLALAPLFVVLFGFGIVPKLIIVALMAFFPIVVNFTIGLKGVPLEMRSLARSTGAGRLTWFRLFALPHALPHLFAGIKLGVTVAVVGAVVGEFIGASSGLGYLVVSGMSRQSAPLVYASMLTMVVMAVALFVAVSFLERLAIPWHVSQRQR